MIKLLPSEETIKQQQQALPQFQPYDAEELKHDAQTLMENRKLAPGLAIDAARSEKEAKQVQQLLACLGSDPNNPDWQAAFLALARLYCNVGRLSQRLLGPHLQAQTWTRQADIVLVKEVIRREEELGSERAALEAIAKDATYQKLLPYRPQNPGTRGTKRSVRERVNALRKRLERIKQAHRGDSLGRQLGMIRPEEELQYRIWYLFNPPPMPPKPKS
jgi:hypothetical protein